MHLTLGLLKGISCRETLGPGNHADIARSIYVSCKVFIVPILR